MPLVGIPSMMASRVSGDNPFAYTVTPNQIAGLKTWYKADALSFSDGQSVGGTGFEWIDSSGNGRPLVQATGASQPLFKTSIVNGNPIVRYDGVDDKLSTSTGGSYTLAQVFYFFCVAKQTSKSSDGRLVAIGSCRQEITQTNGFALISFGALFNDSIDHSGAFHVFVARYDNTNSKIWVDNVLTTGAIGGSGSAGPNEIDVGWSATSGGQITGDIAEVAIYESDVSDTDRIGLQNWFKKKYATP